MMIVAYFVLSRGDAELTTRTMDFQANVNIDAHVRALGQKYMGVKPNQNGQDVFGDPAKASGGHSLPVDNFLNAQCMLY